MKIKPIAAQLRQRHWSFTTAGFVLEPGTMLNSMSPILHLCTLSALINQKFNHITETAFFSSTVSSLSLIIRAWSSSYDNCMILRHGMCLKAPHALWLLGESKRQLSVAHSRQVTAEWPNCLSCCLSRLPSLPSPSSSPRSMDFFVHTGLTLLSDPCSSLVSELPLCPIKHYQSASAAL